MKTLSEIFHAILVILFLLAPVLMFLLAGLLEKL